MHMQVGCYGLGQFSIAWLFEHENKTQKKLLDRMVASGGWIEPKVRYRAFPPPLKHTLGTLHRAINPVDLLPHQS